MKQELENQLRGDEGVRSCVYQDSLGFWTLGVGRLVDSRKTTQGLRPVEISFLLQNDIDDRIESLTRRLPWFQDLDDARRGVLVNMAFQLGTEGLLGFVNTLGMIERGEYPQAADAMMQSKWASQTPARAGRLSQQMRLGVWQYSEVS
jgi:lysozyme